MKSPKLLVSGLVILIAVLGLIFGLKKSPEPIAPAMPKELVTYSDPEYDLSFSYPTSWGDIETVPGNKECPEEDTYRTPESLSIFDKEFRFADIDLENTDSFIRSGIRVYRMDPTQSNNCNDEVLRKLAAGEINGETFSSFRLENIEINSMRGVHNEQASRLDTEGREQYTLFVQESATSILVIQPYMSFIPYADSPEWLEIDSKYDNNMIGYINNGDSAGQIREFITKFRGVVGSVRNQ